MALILRYAVRSDLGLVRGNNEDSVYAGPRLLAVADGMGGHAAGEVASKIVIGTLESLDEDRAPGDVMAALRDAVLDANQRIADAVQQDPSLDGMGTTLTALRFVGSRVGLVHVGDSRAYLLRGDLLSQITHDDTYVQYLVDIGKLTPDEAKDHPRRSVILKALRGAEVDPDVSIREARAGDRYLLCSDGLSDVVSTETILDTLRVPDPQECADRLVELALRGGGPDNVTVIVADAVEARAGDVIDDVPVIAGAFVDPSAADVPGTDSPAERAAQMSRPKAPAQAPQAAAKRRPRWRLIALLVVIAAMVIGLLAGVYAWTQSYYFVGRDGTEVAIFRGVNTSFGPLKFYEVDENTDLKLADLDPSSRSQVSSGIAAGSKDEARKVITRLEADHMLPLCSQLQQPTITPTSSAPPPPPTTHAATTPKTTPRTTPKTTPKTTPPTTPISPTATPAAPTSPAPTVSYGPDDCRNGS